ncbi:hypothetical protein MKW94_028514 [Papaver nudicaule]|uniref:Glycosyltransferase n=1 Tax=Papaver nudicaule TaxID=74823 RepID=A0AA41RT98_PAPNU|nr:hypothetical protein [Papaver nudicaule]
MASSVDHHHKLHFVLFPLMQQGHMIPMIDMARLFAERNIIVTIVTTPANSLRFKKVVDRSVESGLCIRLLILPFPSANTGLPEGCENIDALPSPEWAFKFLKATTSLQESFEKSFLDLEPVPSCIISDMAFPWTAEIADKFKIPRISFYGTSCFYQLCSHNILQSKILESTASLSDPFIVPGLPDQIKVTKAILPRTLYPTSDDLIDFCDQIRKAELTAYGVVVNSFQELETVYEEEYQQAKFGKVWCVGPVSLCNREILDKAERGNKTIIDENQCLKWLDSRDPGSVVYACFGSLCALTSSEMIELALGLEASKCPFVWKVGYWLHKEEFEERNKDRGLVIKGWAPQVLILSHRSIGGFLTHCGWNSVMEGVCAGVLLIAWPTGAEQFFNEKLIVQVLGIGVKVGADDILASDTKLVHKEKVLGSAKNKGDVEKAVKKLMEEGKEGEERRRKVRDFGKKANRAMEEGGSSHNNLTLLIQNIMQYQANMGLPCQVQKTA